MVSSSTRRFTGRSGAVLQVDTIGTGTPIVALHGAYSTSHEIRQVLEPILAGHGGYRGIYPDLPGMGDSPAHESVRSARDVVRLLDELVEAELGAARFLLVGHSFGGHLARGLAARRGPQVMGMALLCPAMPAMMNAEPRVEIRIDDPTSGLEPALVDDYTSYFVLQSAATLERFRAAVVPALGRYDGDAVHRVMAEWALDPDPDTMRFEQPMVVLTGRHDSLVGHRDQLTLLDTCPHASYAVVADAGHAVPHEHPELVAALLGDWLDRCAPMPRSPSR